MICESLSTP